MFSTPRPRWLRPSLFTLFGALVIGAWLVHTGQSVQAPGPAQPDPNVIWRIGLADGLSDEFGLAPADDLTYTIGTSTPREGWRHRQIARAANPPAYRIHFTLDAVPQHGAALEAGLFFVESAPRAMLLDMNGKRGSFRLRGAAAEDTDERQANSILHSRQSLRMPIPSALLRKGANEIAISLLGDTGAIEYDSLALLKSTAPLPKLDATVEPTIFFRRRTGQLTELTEVVLHHTAPIGKVQVSLTADGPAVSSPSEDTGHDFGERVVELDVPAPSGIVPYEVTVASTGKPVTFRGEFRPEKQWKIFAGLKIHNDIGYTDLQPHVQELDNRNTDGVLDIIARSPFYKFNFETSWLAENYLQSRKPARAHQFMKLATAEQIGVNAMYLNVMTGLCTGEEMHRLLYYSQGLRKKYGIPLKFACLTDAPSHTWFVPSLLNEAGVPGFANGSNQTRAPLLQNSNLNEDSPFYWEGIDGRRVLTWFARSYLQFYRLAGENPSVDLLRRSVSQFLARYRRGNYPVDAVLLYGLYTDNADLGHGDVETIRQWNEAFEYPKIIAATDGDYYEYLSRNFAGKLPVYRGDAGAYWEDGAGSTALETTINRDSQRMLPVAEMAAALAGAFRPEEVYPAAEFRDAWKNLLFYDEHTWGANSSVKQPGRRFVTAQWEHKRAYAWRAHWAATDLLYRSFNRLVQNISVDGPTLYVFNPDLWPRSDMVNAEIEPSREIVDMTTGKPVAVDVVSETDGWRKLRFLAENVPGLGYRAYAVRNITGKVPSGTESQPQEWQLESTFYRLTLDPATGAIAGLLDKETGRDLVDSAAPYKLNQLVYVSGGERSRILQDLSTLPAPRLDLSGPLTARIVESVRTPYGKRIRVRAEAKNVPVIDTEISLYDGMKRVDIVNRLEKRETRDKEAVYFAFPFRVSPPELAYQVQNAWVRPNEDQLPGACRDWFTTQNLVRVRDAGITIAWATPDAPLITLTDVNRGLWLKYLTVNNGHVFSYAMNNYWFTNYKAAQGGELTFRYAITSGRDLGDDALARFDQETRSPLFGYAVYDLGNNRLKPAKRLMAAASGSFLNIEPTHAQVTAFKEAEDGDGFILRLRETAGKPGTARVASPVFPLLAAELTNGVEDGATPVAVSANRIELPLKPYGFTTVRLKLGRP
jgi:alpha-mannosidase